MPVRLDFITPNAEELIGRYAAICYDANIEKDACIRRAKKCSEDGHLATLRFAHAVFHITGISRACSHQFVRSKHLDFLQRSQRYCKDEQAEFIYPKLPEDILIEVEASYNYSRERYKSLLASGVKKEDARYVLPAAIETELYVVGNLQAWRDFIKLRADKHAQWELRSIAVDVNNLLSKECPNLFTVMEDKW